MSENTTRFIDQLPDTVPAPDKNSIFTRTNLLFIALLVVAIIAVFFPTLSAGFVDWDDPANLLHNKQLDGPLNWNTIHGIFTSDINGNYNPLPIFTFALEKHFFAPIPTQTPFIFHFNNLWMHIMCSIFVFVLSLKLGLRPAGAFITALLFGIHPMRVESVAWVTERKDVLYGMFYLAALICYVNFRKNDSGKLRWYWITLALAILSGLSKIQAVSLPLSMVAIDYFMGDQWWSKRLLIVEKFPFWVISVFTGLANLSFLNKGGHMTTIPQLERYTFIDKLAVGAYTYGTYLVKSVLPFELTHYHEYPVHMPAIAYVLLIVLPLAIAAFIFRFREKRYHYIIFGLAFFTVNVIFMLQIIPVGTAFLADRFTYIAYLGLFFITGNLHDLLTEKLPKHGATVRALLMLYFLALGLKTLQLSETWNDTLSLCKQNIRTYPKSYYGYQQAGVYYFKQSFDSAVGGQRNKKALETAGAYFLKADQLDSANNRPVPAVSSNIYQNLGIVCGIIGDQYHAIGYFSKAIDITPNDVESIKNRAYQFFVNKQYILAIVDYNKAIQLQAGNSDLYYLRANCYYSKGDIQNAKADLGKAIALGSQNPNCFIAMSVILRAENDVIHAREYARKAQQLGGNVPDQYFQ